MINKSNQLLMFMFVTLVCLFVDVFGWCQFLTGLTNKCCNTWIYNTLKKQKQIQIHTNLNYILKTDLIYLL